MDLVTEYKAQVNRVRLELYGEQTLTFLHENGVGVPYDVKFTMSTDYMIAFNARSDCVIQVVSDVNDAKMMEVSHVAFREKVYEITGPTKVSMGPFPLWKLTGSPIEDRYVVSSFTPASLDLHSWFKGNSGLFQDSARTIPAVLNDDPVGAWSDLSGNGNHLIQPINNNFRPKLKLAVANGKPSVRTDGVDDYLRILFAAVIQPFTLGLVFRIPAHLGSPKYLFDGGSADNVACWDPNAAELALYAGSQVNVGYTFNTFVSLQMFVNGAASRYHFNNSADVVVNLGLKNLNGVTLGGRGGAGDYQPGGFYSAADFLEEVICLRELTPSERADLDQYFDIEYSLY